MKYIVPVLVGSFIGYITNYLAIKMLFRPYSEIRIFGFKIPFTPGLIPKEKNRIAKSVGEAVGTHLLSSDVIIETLISDRVKNEMTNYIEKRIILIKNSTKSIKNLAEDLGADFNKLKNILSYSISKLIIKIVKSNYSREKIENILKKYLVESFTNIIDSLYFKNIINDLDSVFYKSLNNYKNFIKSKADEALLNLKDDNRYLIQVIPIEITNKIKYLINKNGEKQSQFLLELIRKKTIRDEIKRYISSLVEVNLGRFATMLISIDHISERILLSFETYLQNPENYNKVSSFFESVVDKVLEIKVSDITSFINNETSNSIIDNIWDKILINYLTDENKNKVKNYIKSLINSNNENIIMWISNCICNLIENEMETEKTLKFLESIATIIINYIGTISISNLMLSIELKSIRSFIDLIQIHFENFIKDRASAIVELIDIPNMVENRINSFEPQFAEKVILEVANKELAAITWLGALLGGIMGLLTPLLIK